MKEDFLKAHGQSLVSLKEAELELRKGLPHIYGLPFYKWTREFFESRDKIALMTAGNQLGKSSAMIRTAIEWAINKNLWAELWPKSQSPNLFLYFYPTNNQATIEATTKWPQFLPRNGFENHPDFGYTIENKNKEVHAIHFNSGVSIYFKSYKQGKEALQTATAYAIFLDEECDADLWDELSFRVAATQGYIRSAFTATQGQEFWRQAMEPTNSEEERFPKAWKRQISAYDCLEYEDGSPTPWNNSRINELIATCRSPQEVQRRVFGKFVKESGLIYPSFEVKRHMKPWHPVPQSWLWYVIADVGSGKTSSDGYGHPSGIVVLAAKPDFTTGRVVHCWRSDGTRTTAGDVYNKAEEIIRELKVQPVAKIYDWGCADFGTIATRNGGGWEPAKKGTDEGEQIVNTLFKNDMLAIYERGENGKLAGELCSVSHETPKNKRADDLCDPLRYGCMKIPWNWTVIQGGRPDGIEDQPEKQLNEKEKELQARREFFQDDKRSREEAELQAEFNEIQAMYDG